MKKDLTVVFCVFGATIEIDKNDTIRLTSGVYERYAFLKMLCHSKNIKRIIIVGNTHSTLYDKEALEQIDIHNKIVVPERLTDIELKELSRLKKIEKDNSTPQNQYNIVELLAKRFIDLLKKYDTEIDSLISIVGPAASGVGNAIPGFRKLVRIAKDDCLTNRVLSMSLQHISPTVLALNTITNKNMQHIAVTQDKRFFGDKEYIKFYITDLDIRPTVILSHDENLKTTMLKHQYNTDHYMSLSDDNKATGEELERNGSRVPVPTYRVNLELLGHFGNYDFDQIRKSFNTSKLNNTSTIAMPQVPKSIVIDTKEYRFKRMKELFLDKNLDVKVFGPWGKVYSDQYTQFRGSLDRDEMNDLLKTERFTLIIPPYVGYVTCKFAAAILNGCIPFVDNNFDLDYVYFKKDSYLRIKSGEELLSKMNKINRDATFRETIIDELINIVKDKLNGIQTNAELLRATDTDFGIDTTTYKVYKTKKVENSLELKTSGRGKKSKYYLLREPKFPLFSYKRQV